jgi:predicted membrane chloride channel (bestrophin family)
MENIGVCERIQETPMPFAYVVHLRRALIICSRIDQNLTSVLKPTPAANRSALTQDEKRSRVS